MTIAMLTKSVRKLTRVGPLAAEAWNSPFLGHGSSRALRPRPGVFWWSRGETGLNRSNLPRCRNAGKLTSCRFVGRWGDVDLNLLHTKVGVDRFQDRLAGIFLSANPDCPGSAYQRKRIVADQICRAL